jgi:hypothetical protein
MVLASVEPARAQAVIKVNEDVNLKFGVLGQFQADWLEDPVSDTTAQNLFIRRIRLIFGGQVAKHVTFFVETDSPNLGKVLASGKNITPSMIIQDAYGEFKVNDAFAIDGGLMFVPFSRNAIQSAATLLPIDYGAFTFTQSAPTQSSTGRDTGFQARGYVLKNRLEYRIGAFQGARNARSNNSLRYTGRVQYEFLESEGTGFFYTGTYLGKKKVLAVGGAFDKQGDFHAYDGDAFVDFPVGPGAVTGQVAYNRFKGGTPVVPLPKQNVVLVEAGYYINALRVTPVFQFTNRDIIDTSVGDQRNWSIGANYWWAGHNANIKSAYGRLKPRGLKAANEFTVQLQVFYF